MFRFRLFHTAGFRFGAIYALLLSISAFAMAIFLWWATAGLLNRETDAAIYADAQDLATRWRDGGFQALASTIDDRLAQNVDDDALYLLVDQGMRRVAGNLSAWPAGVDETNVAYELRLQRAGMTSLAQVRRYNLANGYHLLIGRDVRLRAQLRTLLTDALLWSMLIALTMATLGGLIVPAICSVAAWQTSRPPPRRLPVATSLGACA